MARVKAASVSRSTSQKLDPKTEADRICSIVAYHYKAYTLAQARRLPYKDVLRLYHTIQQEQARQNFELLQIVTAPHTAKGKGLKQLSEHYKKIMKGNNG